MHQRPFWILTALLTSTLALAEDRAPSKTNERVVEAFEKEIRPLLVEHCHDCHGPVSGQGEGELRLDSLAAVLRGGQSGPAVTPGEPDKSLLIHAVNHEPSVKAMPPGKRLKRDEIARLVRWVEMKKPWPRIDASARKRKTDVAEITAEERAYWAFAAPVEPSLPDIRGKHWVTNPIDAFVLARLEQVGLAPSPPLDRRTLIRRATFDLHGLPPTPDEVETFLRDESPNAYRRLVDRLLASPRYGEKWGRHWLDVARYSDSNGMDDNIAYAEAWRYRDYVIDSLNSDKPYDKFAREQIAGDLMTTWTSPNRAESVIATTFLMLGPKMPSADDPVKQQLDIVDEQVDTVGRVFMALTLGCARCHAHKFDPISSRDYYALAGIFKSTRSMLGYRVDAKFNLTALESESRNNELSRLEREMDVHDDVLVNGNKLNMSKEQRKQHTDELNAAYAGLEKIATAMAVEEGTIGDMPVLLRGNHLTPADIVARGAPRILDERQQLKISEGESGRRQLAEWLTSRSHPLTARVMANRIWAWHFSEGLVRSVDNFGRLGQRPDNQPLLDWLAIRLIESDWSIKRLHRLIMNSSAYRMASHENPRGVELDLDNRRWWRMNPRRLEAEELRDTLLMLSERLDSRMGGRMMPVRNHKIMSTKEIDQCNAVHRQPRRTIYLPVIRSGLHEFLKTFDFPDPSTPVGRRDSTTVSPQALFMMNGSLATESSRAIARILIEREPNARRRIIAAHLRILSRPPRETEIAAWSGFLRRRRALPAESPKNVEVEVWSSVARVLLSSNEFMYVK